jgi:hypothetical protein
MSAVMPTGVNDDDLFQSNISHLHAKKRTITLTRRVILSSRADTHNVLNDKMRAGSEQGCQPLTSNVHSRENCSFSDGSACSLLVGERLQLHTTGNPVISQLGKNIQSLSALLTNAWPRDEECVPVSMNAAVTTQE